MKDLIQNKLDLYDCLTVEDEENAIKEITQEVALYGLKEAGFFEKASFQGGTCLRIVHGLDRFSEDLDFALRSPIAGFELRPYLDKLKATMEVYGYNIEIFGEDKASASLQSRFLKDDSIKKMLNLEHSHDQRKKIQIKLEVDVNPPGGSVDEINYVDFPLDFMITTHDLPSLFSGKCHALLCRPYVKGRDWYDFLWYLSKGVELNLAMLEAALLQHGPWKNQVLKLNKAWITHALQEKISSLDWKIVSDDVSRFLKPEKRRTLELWSKDFFLKKVTKL